MRNQTPRPRRPRVRGLEDLTFEDTDALERRNDHHRFDQEIEDSDHAVVTGQGARRRMPAPGT